MSLHLELLLGSGFNYYTEQNPLVKNTKKEKATEDKKRFAESEEEGKDEAEERKTKTEKINNKSALSGETIYFSKVPVSAQVNVVIGICKNIPVNVVIGGTVMSTIFNSPVDKDGKEISTKMSIPIIAMLSIGPRYYVTKNFFGQIGLSASTTVYGGSMAIQDSFNVGVTIAFGGKYKAFRGMVEAHAKLIAPIGSEGSEIKNYGVSIRVGGGLKLS